MNEHPIIFSAPMVRAILAGTKSQTRRTCRGQRELSSIHDFRLDGCPYGQPGDWLWVRESWQYANWTEEGEPYIRYAADGAQELFDVGRIPDGWFDRLEDIWAGLSTPENYAIDNRAADRRWRPSIHMPRWASRITLEVTGVRVERLQDISDADAEAEGLFKVEIDPGYWPKYGANPFTWAEAVEHQAECFEDPRLAYRALWEQINGAGSWDANPWVWVVSFRLA